jgi:hypothetical protein
MYKVKRQELRRASHVDILQRVNEAVFYQLPQCTPDVFPWLSNVVLG